MPDANDYGTADDRTLVPGTLRVFRHFQMDMARGELFPMNHNPTREQMGYALTAADRAYERGRFNLSTDPEVDPDDFGIKAPVWEARCSRQDPLGLGYRTSHPSPRAECACGFYAHYDPATDFYPGWCWGRNYHRGNPDNPWNSMVIVRAVCEVSGTVVMGRRGVRAQKMKLVALAADWEKWIGALTPDGFRRRYEVAYDSVSGRGRLVIDGPEIRDVKAKAREVAQMYGCAFYDDAEAMYAARPKADISALGVDTAPQPRPAPKPKAPYAPGGIINTPRKSGRSAYSHQAAFYINAATGIPAHMTGLGNAAQQASQALRGYIVVDEEVTTTQAQMERLLEAKRNRPAPPGSGIDRRRGRLR